MTDVQHLGHGQITLANAPIITFSSWDEDLKSNSKLYNMIGMHGITDGVGGVQRGSSRGRLRGQGEALKAFQRGVHRLADGCGSAFRPAFNE